MCHVAFDDDKIIEDAGLDVNQINKTQSDGVVDSNCTGVTKIKGAHNQKIDTIDTLEDSRRRFSK